MTPSTLTFIAVAISLTFFATTSQSADFFSHHPENATVAAGDDAIFTCQMKHRVNCESNNNTHLYWIFSWGGNGTSKYYISSCRSALPILGIDPNRVSVSLSKNSYVLQIVNVSLENNENEFFCVVYFCADPSCGSGTRHVSNHASLTVVTATMASSSPESKELTTFPYATVTTAGSLLDTEKLTGVPEVSFEPTQHVTKTGTMLVAGTQSNLLVLILGSTSGALVTIIVIVMVIAFLVSRRWGVCHRTASTRRRSVDIQMTTWDNEETGKPTLRPARAADIELPYAELEFERGDMEAGTGLVQGRVPVMRQEGPTVKCSYAKLKGCVTVAEM
ncbi:uncharacterized protein LOC119729643 isoform X2 [Patiria miniata]|uniref:Immunoglobulin domain-containing protein n=1 Tax=Patiria miniata TaxID=46514 RepID=A0A914A3T0_PATMI|nr:uncharacterized protein LOC119729643 isoform X2 [Patiria miniata]